MTPARTRLGRLWLLLTDPARWSAERYAASSAMHLSAVQPASWRQDLGSAAEPGPAAAPRPRYAGRQEDA